MTGADAGPIGIIVLAAGSSRRLGHPKQLVKWQESTLLRHAAQVAVEAALGPVLVVLGASAEACAKEIEGLDVSVLVHEAWSEGIGSTISAGVRHLTGGDLSPDALIISACDQPRVTPADFQALAAQFRATAAPVVASSYAGTSGIPALFASPVYPRLEGLTGDLGARTVLRAERETLVSVPCPRAEFDVDTETDVLKLG